MIEGGVASIGLLSNINAPQNLLVGFIPTLASSSATYEPKSLRYLMHLFGLRCDLCANKL